jgi:hypothetical protein
LNGMVGYRVQYTELKHLNWLSAYELSFSGKL